MWNGCLRTRPLQLRPADSDQPEGGLPECRGGDEGALPADAGRCREVGDALSQLGDHPGQAGSPVGIRVGYISRQNDTNRQYFFDGFFKGTSKNSRRY